MTSRKIIFYSFFMQLLSKTLIFSIFLLLMSCDRQENLPPTEISAPLKNWLQQKSVPLSSISRIAITDDLAPLSSKLPGECFVLPDLALVSSSEFRKLDRQNRNDLIILSGPPARSRILLDHLLESNDWPLVYLDDAHYVFLRNAPKTWSPASLEELTPFINALSSPEQKADFYTHLGTRLHGIRQNSLAQSQYDKALSIRTDHPPALLGIASLAAANGNWHRVAEITQRILQEQPDAPNALYLAADASYRLRDASKAYQHSSRLLHLVPDQPLYLFLHAKICHASHDYKEEIQTLNKLIAMATEKNLPTASYKMYLAQAYSSNAQPRLALQKFLEIKDSPDLNPDEQSFVQKALDRLSR